MDGSWFKGPTIQQVTVDEDKTIDVDVELKDIADGNLEHLMVGEWHTEPELIFDGGG